MDNQGFKLRVQYKKTGNLRFLSHLEVLRAIERMVRRADLPFMLSQGFSPHIRFAFSPALPLAASSEDEYFDLLLDSFIDAESCLARLQAVSQKDLYPLKASFVDVHAPSLSASLTISEYAIELETEKLSLDLIEQGLNALLEQNYIELFKKGKMKQIELSERLPQAPELKPSAMGATLHLYTRSLESGSLRPDIFIDKLAESIQKLTNKKLIAERALQFDKLNIAIPFKRYEVFESVGILRKHQYFENEDGTWDKAL
ncbi:MAG: TIGR03936 family radical SAM-associated protein [Coriobacteriia bacterium]|nr:TIGR03936 family radical SAM-associated protein [Coriobacteriia bacterium]